jgi:hypothetical protein
MLIANLVVVPTLSGGGANPMREEAETGLGSRQEGV